jgi:hypothetical protein
MVEDNTVIVSHGVSSTNLLFASAFSPNLGASITWQFDSQTESITPIKLLSRRGTLCVSIGKKVETRINTCATSCSFVRHSEKLVPLIGHASPTSPERSPETETAYFLLDSHNDPE